MSKFIQIDNGHLYAYNEKGYNLVLNDEQKWEVSKFDCSSILYSDRKDYSEYSEEEVSVFIGEQLVKDANDYFEKIDKELKNIIKK